ncbi:cysteine proteinase, partial [Tilletiopsis washingtonensis]
VNDTIIELGLSLLHEKIRQQNPALAAQIHIFSSFFYKRLTENKDKAAGFESVRKWAKTNVFEKKYLVVPINEHLHWYLAIVVNPSFCIAPHALEKRAIEEAERTADSRYRGWLKDSTTVCIFDSLGGKHQAVRTNLAGYLTRQHLSLRAQTPPGELKKEELLKTEHIDVAMPQQPNLSDCGVYVLHTFECFF